MEWIDDLLTHYKSRKRKDIFFVFVEWCEKALHDYTFPSWHIVYIPVERRDTDLLKKRKEKSHNNRADKDNNEREKAHPNEEKKLIPC